MMHGQLKGICEWNRWEHCMQCDDKNDNRRKKTIHTTTQYRFDPVLNRYALATKYLIDSLNANKWQYAQQIVRQSQFPINVMMNETTN